MVMAAVLCGLNVSAAPSKAPARSNIYSTLPDNFVQLGNTSIYYQIAESFSNGPGRQYGISILGEIDNQYYSCTFEHEEVPEWWEFWETYVPSPGAGFVTAFKVNENDAMYLDALNGSTMDGVTVTTHLEPQGDVCARVVYTFTNDNSEAVTVSAGVWGDIMIGDNDNAPLELMTSSSGIDYGIKMKYKTDDDSPMLCALFGEGVTGVTAADEYWFGFFSSNWHPNEMVGEYYSSTIYNTVNYQGRTMVWPASNSQYYLKENIGYDSGLGFCWKDRTIPAGESIELSYLISVGFIDFEEPIDPDPEPGEDIRTLHLEAFDCDGWNDYTAEHPIRIWGYYEHPYGQSGYFEYQIDNEFDTGHDLPTIYSGEDYDINFTVQYDPERTDYHVIRVRFNDGLGNVSATLDSLVFVDVRSLTVTGIEDRVYNGAPQVFNVGVNRETFIGETYPGDYNYTLEGAFIENTIGVKEVPYTIDRAPCEYTVVSLPEKQIKKDGEQHGAVVTVPEGSGNLTVIYRNLVTNEESTTPPSEVGRYVIIVYVDDSGELYKGTEETFDGEVVIWEFEIYLKYPTAVNELNADREDNGAWYTIDGRRVVAPTERGIYIHNGKKYIVK